MHIHTNKINTFTFLRTIESDEGSEIFEHAYFVAIL